jgi:hypothetical protein
MYTHTSPAYITELFELLQQKTVIVIIDEAPDESAEIVGHDVITD